jgi:RNA polymerase sigma-70 factor, ECF subfamily
MRARVVDPDATLVAAAREEPRAFLTLYDRYFDRVLGYVRLRIRDAATCEDVTSTVFTTALAQLPRFRGEGSFAGWLFQIARNAVRDVHRKSADAPLLNEVVDSEPDVEERFLAHERAAQLHALIRLLEPEQQHLLALRYGAGLAFDEIGVAVGAAPGTVRVRIHRILEELRRRYPHDD